MKLNEQKLNGFRVFWIQYKQESSDRHQLFAKEHLVRRSEPQYPKGRTLFLLNVPPYVQATSLQNALEKICGSVKSVTFAPRSEQSQNGFKTCYVVFETEFGLDKVLMLPRNHVLILQSPETCATGVARWCKEYNETVCNEERTKIEIEKYMREYEERVANRFNEDANDSDDKDGWVKVSGKKKRGQHALRRTEMQIDKVRRKQAKSNEKKQLVNFYTFQIRESKKQNLAVLRQKFEQDKTKLQQLKLKRTFKPF